MRLDPLKAARQDAIHGERNIGLEQYSRYEHEVLVAFQAEVDSAKKALEGGMRELDQRVKRVPPNVPIDKRGILIKIEMRLVNFFRAQQEMLRSAREDMLSARRLVRKFRSEHRLLRPYYEKNAFVAVLGAIFLMLLEALLNFYLLASIGIDSPTNIVLAVVIAAVFNVFLSVCIGYIGFRYLNHKNYIWKLFALVFIVSSFGIVVIIHLGLANFRHVVDAALSDPNVVGDALAESQALDAARETVIQNMLETPFVFLTQSDIPAIGVFCYGLAFACAAILEGYYLFEDPYPGYGSVARAHKRANERQTELQTDFVDKIEKIAESGMKEVTSSVDAAEQRLRGIKAVFDDASSLIRRYDEAAILIEKTYYNLVSDYRDEYVHIREVDGPVFWQDQILHLDTEHSINLDGVQMEEEREVTEFQRIDQEADNVIESISAMKSELVSRIESYLDNVDKEAKEEEAALARVIGVTKPRQPGKDAQI